MSSEPRVLVGVSGGIAIYKMCYAVRTLTEKGMAVDVVMTASATEFVRPVTFEALTKRPVQTSLWERDAALSHIHLGQNADVILLAPATANLLAKAAGGIADDLLTTMLLASHAPVLVAPAMNDSMWADAVTQANVARLREKGWRFIGPSVGGLAEGPSNMPGRMVEPDVLVARVEREVIRSNSKLDDTNVLVTAGPTRERIDPVRIISNPSSGRMGFAVAERAYARGAKVTLIAGPTELPAPSGVELIRVETTEQLHNAVAKHLKQANVMVMAAAPADYRPTEEHGSKVPKQSGGLTLPLEPTQDVLEGTVDCRRKGAIMVGFALESDHGVENAKAKLTRKQLDLIVLNMAGESGAGFESPTNKVVLVTERDTIDLPLMSKTEVASRILDKVEEML